MRNIIYIFITLLLASCDLNKENITINDNLISSNYRYDIGWTYYRPDYAKHDNKVYCAFPNKDKNNFVEVLVFNNNKWSNLNFDSNVLARDVRINVNESGEIYLFFYESINTGDSYNDYTGKLHGYVYRNSLWEEILEKEILFGMEDYRIEINNNVLYLIYEISKSDVYGLNSENEYVQLSERSNSLNLLSYNGEWIEYPQYEIDFFVGSMTMTVDYEDNVYIAFKDTFLCFNGVSFEEVIITDGLESNVVINKYNPVLKYANNKIILLSEIGSYPNDLGYFITTYTKINNVWNKQIYVSISNNILSDFSVEDINDSLYISSYESSTEWGTIPKIYKLENGNILNIDLSYFNYSGLQSPEGYGIKTNFIQYEEDRAVLLYPNYNGYLSALIIDL